MPSSASRGWPCRRSCTRSGGPTWRAWAPTRSTAAAWSYGLGLKLIDARLSAAREHGFEYLFVTVAPDNPPSLCAVERAGFQRLDLATVYSERVLRVLLYCPLSPARERVA